MRFEGNCLFTSEVKVKVKEAVSRWEINGLNLRRKQGGASVRPSCDLTVKACPLFKSVFG